MNEAYFCSKLIQNDLALYTRKMKHKISSKMQLYWRNKDGTPHIWVGGSAFIKDALTGCIPAFKRIQYHLHRRWLMSLFRKDEESHMLAFFMMNTAKSHGEWRAFQNSINRISLQSHGWNDCLCTCNNFFDLYLPSVGREWDNGKRRHSINRERKDKGWALIIICQMHNIHTPKAVSVLHCPCMLEWNLPVRMYLVCMSFGAGLWGESWGVLVWGRALPTGWKSADAPDFTI